MEGSKPIQVLKDSLYAVKFYYEARPWLFILLVLVFAAQTVLPAAGLLLERAIVDGFVEGAQGFVPLAIAAYLLCRLAGSLGEQYEKLLRTTLSDLANRRTSAVVARLLSSIPTLEIYHDPAYHDSLDTLNSVGRRMWGAVMGITSGGVALLRFASLAVVLSGVHPWIPLILVLSLIPHAVLERRLSEARFKGTVALAPERRKIDYTQGLLFDPAAAKEVKLFGLAPYLFDLCKSLFDAAFRRQSAIHRRQTLLAVAGSLLSLAGLSATVILTIQQFRTRAVSAGSLVMAFRALQSMPAYAGGVVRSWGMALENSMYMGRLRTLVSTVVKTSAPQGASELDAPLETIEASAVGFRYPGSSRPALDGVNLTLRRGETVALVGLNGAGKTTLAKLLLGLYRPSEGRLLYNGRSVSEYDLGSLRKRMGCLFQDFVKYLLKANILRRGSILYSEVEFLMRQELRETSVYNTIISAVALGNTRLNDIFQKTQIEKTKLTVYLKNLTELGIVRREFPVADRIKRQANVQRGLYQISDHFFRFWYAFVFPNMSELEAGDAQGIYRHVVQPNVERYASHAFEDACREYLRRLNRQDKLPFHFTRIGRWWEKGTEIDILATDQEGKHYLVGECKFKTSPFGLGELKALLEKFRPDKRAARIYYWLFSRSGFTDEVRKAAENQGVELVELDRMV